MTKNARRRLIIVTTALACLLATDVWVRRMEPALQVYHDDPFLRACNNLPHRGLPDIVLMGSSRAQYALVPDEFRTITGKRTHNAAVPGSVVLEWQLLARKLFAHEQPSLVVLGINAQELRADYVPTRAAQSLFTFSDLLEYSRQDHPSGAVGEQYIRHTLGPAWALFDSRFELKMWGHQRLAPVLPSHAQQARWLREWVARPVAPDGFDHPWLSGRRLPTLEDRWVVDRAQVPAPPPPKFSPAASPMARLRRLLDWFRENAVPVLVVYLPNSPATEERWREVEPAAIEAIAQACREHGAPFLRFDGGQIRRTNADFVDETHVGLPLARRISRRAAGLIITLGLLNREDRHFAGSRDVAAAAGYASREPADPADSPK